MSSRSRSYWPSRIGRLELDGELVTICASYVDPLTGAEYRAGCERGGHRGRRGWWVQSVTEGVRSGGYRDFEPATQEQAIRQLRSIASATVGTGDWATVSIPAEIEDTEQGGLDQWGTA